MTDRGTAGSLRASGALTPQQVKFFETFGFLRLPGLMSDDIDEIIEAFEDVFARVQPRESHEEVHFSDTRETIDFFLEHDPRLKRLESDPRVLGVVSSLLGDRFEYRQTDGNLLFCDTSWHCDMYGSPLDQYHVKLFFYLDPLDAGTGGLRVLPGTNFYDSEYASQLRRELHQWSSIESRFGVAPEEIPSYSLESNPGDLIVGSFRTMHATFGGAPRRRLFTMNYRQVAPDA